MKAAARVVFFTTGVLLLGKAPTLPANAQTVEQVPKIQIVSSGIEDPQTTMMTEIITGAFSALSGEAADKAVSVSKVNDRQLQLDPLLTRKVFDAGIAWQKPDCTSKPLSKMAVKLCDSFFFSKPLFNIVLRAFVKKADRLSMHDLSGKSICTDRSAFTWPGQPVNIVRTKTLHSCFEMLQRGEVSGVVSEERAGARMLREFAGDTALAALPRPVSKRSYHAIVAKSHPRARTFIYFINSALDKLHQSGGYAGILAKYQNAQSITTR